MTNWFYLISFESEGVDYLMITNNRDNDHEEIVNSIYTYEKEVQYDGPTNWVEPLQDIIETELDEYSTLEFDFFCCYEEHRNDISEMLDIIILEYNLYWNDD